MPLATYQVLAWCVLDSRLVFVWWKNCFVRNMQGTGLGTVAFSALTVLFE